jgi:hypothetical protein
MVIYILIKTCSNRNIVTLDVIGSKKVLLGMFVFEERVLKLEIKDKIQFGESRYLEFKETLPSAKAIAKTAVAFSNGAGGDILIGGKYFRKKYHHNQNFPR